jgi:hypothetical protein
MHDGKDLGSLVIICFDQFGIGEEIRTILATIDARGLGCGENGVYFAVKHLRRFLPGLMACALTLGGSECETLVLRSVREGSRAPVKNSISVTGDTEVFFHNAPLPHRCRHCAVVSIPVYMG